MALTVGELRVKLADLPDEYEVVIGDAFMRVSISYRVQRVKETSLDYFVPNDEHGGWYGKVYYLDDKETPNALCLWA